MISRPNNNKNYDYDDNATNNHQMKSILQDKKYNYTKSKSLLEIWIKSLIQNLQSKFSLVNLDQSFKLEKTLL